MRNIHFEPANDESHPCITFTLGGEEWMAFFHEDMWELRVGKAQGYEYLVDCEITPGDWNKIVKTPELIMIYMGFCAVGILFKGGLI